MSNKNDDKIAKHEIIIRTYKYSGGIIAVEAFHVPTSLSYKCGDFTSIAKNRNFAEKKLLEMIDEYNKKKAD